MALAQQESNKYKVAIFDADLIGRKKHRFPNLASEKISGYWKENGADVKLFTKFPSKNKWYELQSEYSQIYISKVFTDTPIPNYIEGTNNVHMGGTGFYFDKAPNLPDEIEHHMPDYSLYNDWIEHSTKAALKNAKDTGKPFDELKHRVQFKMYTDYSIGFITRGCFRKCPFCVNQKFDHVFYHSPVKEFYDQSRKKICLLDDNFFGYPQWEDAFDEIITTGKKFVFKQGLDERLLTQGKAKMLFNANYDGDYIFAFDNVADYELIKGKLEITSKCNTKKKNVKFYVLVGFESTDATDIENAFKRIELLFRYDCFPYIMRYMDKDDAPWKRSKYKFLYTTIARWCNQPNFVKKMTFREFCVANQRFHKTAGTYCAAMRSMLDFEKEYPEIAGRYFDMRFGEENGKQ